MQPQLNPTFDSNRNATIIFLLVGYAIAFFLYYLDEGNYHFKGLAEPTEWIFLSMYALVFFGCMLLTFQFFKKTSLSYFTKLLSSIILGLAILPILIMMISFFS